MSIAAPQPEDATGPESPSDLMWRWLSRVMAVCLLGLWTGLFLVILIAYRPGGPWDALVAAAAFAPVLIAAVAVVWPPMPDPEGRDQWRSRAAIAWVGLLALLLVGSMLVLEVRILAAGGDQALLPSLEVTYALILAIAFLSMFAALGVTRGEAPPGWRGHGRLVHALGIAVVMCVGAAFLMGGAAVANDLALRDQPAGTVPLRTHRHHDDPTRLRRAGDAGTGRDRRHRGDGRHRRRSIGSASIIRGAPGTGRVVERLRRDRVRDRPGGLHEGRRPRLAERRARRSRRSAGRPVRDDGRGRV